MEIVGELQKSDKAKIIVSKTEYGNNRIDVRIWFKGNNNRWIPTRSGISVPVEKWNELMDILKKV